MKNMIQIFLHPQVVKHLPIKHTTRKILLIKKISEIIWSSSPRKYSSIFRWCWREFWNKRNHVNLIDKNAFFINNPINHIFYPSSCNKTLTYKADNQKILIIRKNKWNRMIYFTKKLYRYLPMLFNRIPKQEKSCQYHWQKCIFLKLSN